MLFAVLWRHLESARVPSLNQIFKLIAWWRHDLAHYIYIDKFFMPQIVYYNITYVWGFHTLLDIFSCRELFHHGISLQNYVKRYQETIINYSPEIIFIFLMYSIPFCRSSLLLCSCCKYSIFFLLYYFLSLYCCQIQQFTMYKYMLHNLLHDKSDRYT